MWPARKELVGKSESATWQLQDVTVLLLCRVQLNANYLTLQGKSEGVYQYAVSFQ